MSKIDNYVEWMISVANDSAHGYDQVYRWGEKGDYDCSAFAITALERAGIPAKSKGATYTGNMYSVLTKYCGFVAVTGSVNLRNGTGLQRGDILLNHANHVAVYVGNAQLVQASINERGTVRGGKPGDQKQLRGQRGEINIRSYYNYPWNVVLRYTGERSSAPVLYGNIQLAVYGNIQLAVDGWWGVQTTTRSQQFLGTFIDGIVSGQPASCKMLWPCTHADRSWEWVRDRAGGSSMILALQRLLHQRGLYHDSLDGLAGVNTVKGFQRFLQSAGFYKGQIDGSAGPQTCKAWQQHLNSKRS